MQLERIWQNVQLMLGQFFVQQVTDKTGGRGWQTTIDLWTAKQFYINYISFQNGTFFFKKKLKVSTALARVCIVLEWCTTPCNGSSCCGLHALKGLSGKKKKEHCSTHLCTQSRKCGVNWAFHETASCSAHAYSLSNHLCGASNWECSYAS